MDFVNARPPSANIRVPSMPPWRTSATSVVPPPTSTNSAPAWRTCSAPRTRATAYGSATTSSSSRSSWLATDWSAPRWTSGANALKIADLDVAALEPDRVRQPVAVDRRADDRAVDEPDVDVRQAGLPGDRPLGLLERLALDAVDELDELGVGDRELGLLALLGERRGEALDELAGDADDDLASAGSRPSPRPPGARPRSCRRRRRCPRPCPTACGSGPGACGPTPRTVPWPVSSISNTSALANSVPMSSAVQAAGTAPSSRSRCGAGTPSRPPRPRARPRASRGARRGRPPRRARPRSRPRAPLAACPCPGPSPGGRRRGRRCWLTAAWTSGPAAMPRATRSSLTVTNSCGSSASSPRAITPLGSEPRTSFAKPLSASIDVEVQRGADERDAVADGLGVRRPGRRASGVRRPRRRP